MEQYEAVKPSGPAYALFGSNPVSGALRVACTTGKYAIAPMGSSVAFLGYGPTSGAAIANAVNMLGLGPQTPAQNCIPIFWFGAPRVFTLAPDTFFAAVTPSGNPTAPIIIIPCEGR